MNSLYFTPRPVNDFPEFIETYYRRCQQECPEIEGSAGKWKFEDLIPGLSDFDTRFLTRNGLTSEDWNRLSMAVGRTHLELALERPEWARTLEHLPGVNLTWDELFDPASFYPEFCQWSFHCGQADTVGNASAFFGEKAWSDTDAVYHWKRIALYYGRYNRSIDPPINLGRFESKYPLHSRYLHYLAPPVHSAVCLMEKKTRPGKLDAFHTAGRMFPQPEVMEIVLDGINRHYETPLWYAEPELTNLDLLLEKYLAGVVNTLIDADGTLDCPRNPSVEELCAAMVQLPKTPPISVFFENIKFARFMKGRLWFYAHEVAWFDSPPLIRIELGRLAKNFLVTPLELFSQEILGRKLPWKAVLDELSACGFSAHEIRICRDFHRIADPNAPVSEYRLRASQLVDIYSDFLNVLERISLIARRAMSPPKKDILPVTCPNLPFHP